MNDDLADSYRVPTSILGSGLHTMTDKWTRSNIRTLCWAWIVAGTMAVLFYAPVSVTYRLGCRMRHSLSILGIRRHYLGLRSW